MTKAKKIAITLGDPSGIGYEVTIKALNSLKIDFKDTFLIGNKEILYKKALKLGVNVDKNIEIIDIDCDIFKLETAKPSSEGGKVSFKSLEKACELANSNKISVIVTAPLSKEAINMAGYRYSGQTEVLEKYLAGGQEAEMLFVAKDWRIMLVTRHIPLSQVVNEISVEKICTSAVNLANSLKNNFGIESPKIAICGLNPHAGENGLLGKEEIELVLPAIAKLLKAGIFIEGPFPADTLFAKAGASYLKNEKQKFDGFLSFYHDQGLTPIKAIAMDNTVNMTINLPVIRTSPAHGTAFDIAEKNIADCSSMIAALDLALKITTQETFLVK